MSRKEAEKGAPATAGLVLAGEARTDEGKERRVQKYM